MAIEKQINIVVKETGIENVQNKVNDLDNSLKGVKSNSDKPIGESFFDKIKKGAQEAGNFFDKLKEKLLNLGSGKKGIDDAESSVKKLNKTNESVVKSMGESSNAVLENGGAMGLLNDATGGLAMTVKDAVEASVLFTKSQKLASIQQAIYSTVVGTSTGAMKLFRIALVATGIGALVVGLGLLIANFDKVKKVVLNVVPGLAKVGEFVENLVNGFTDFIGVTSEAERAIASLTEQADKSLAMNKKFMAEDGDLVNKYTKAKIDAKNAYNEAIKEEGANQKKLAERLNRELLAIDKAHNDDLAKAKKEAQDKEDEANKTRTEKQKADRLKAQEDAKKAQEDEDKRKEEKIKSDAEKAIALDEEIKQAQLDVEEFSIKKAEEKTEREDAESANKIARIINESDEEKRLAEEKINLENQVKDAKLDIANQTLELIGTFAKKGSKLAKGVAVAQATMSTYQGITNAFSAPSTVPEPFGMALRIANASVIGASGFANVKNILATNESGTGGGGQSSGVSAPSVSAPSFNLVQGTGTNQIAQGLAQQGTPIKAYVVSSDVSTSQSLDRNIVSEASLG